MGKAAPSFGGLSAEPSKLIGDITDIATWVGWLYLSTVIDCHSKQIIGYAMPVFEPIARYLPDWTVSIGQRPLLWYLGHLALVAAVTVTGTSLGLW